MNTEHELPYLYVKYGNAMADILDVGYKTNWQILPCKVVCQRRNGYYLETLEKLSDIKLDDLLSIHAVLFFIYATVGDVETIHSPIKTELIEHLETQKDQGIYFDSNNSFFDHMVDRYRRRGQNYKDEDYDDDYLD